MATRTDNYDAPIYQVPYIYSGSSAVGAAGVTSKFTAFTAMKIMSIVQGIYIATTAAGSQPLLYTKSGTTTATTTLTVLTSAAVLPITNALATPVTLAAGDQFWYTHGTDAAASVAVSIETRVIPGSTYTV